MRHTLIIISISLFSSFLVSCEKNGPGTETYVGGSSYEGVFKDGIDMVKEHSLSIMVGRM